MEKKLFKVEKIKDSAITFNCAIFMISFVCRDYSDILWIRAWKTLFVYLCMNNFISLFAFLLAAVLKHFSGEVDKYNNAQICFPNKNSKYITIFDLQNQNQIKSLTNYKLQDFHLLHNGYCKIILVGMYLLSLLLVVVTWLDLIHSETATPKRILHLVPTSRRVTVKLHSNSNVKNTGSLRNLKVATPVPTAYNDSYHGVQLKWAAKGVIVPTTSGKKILENGKEKKSSDNVSTENSSMGTLYHKSTPKLNISYTGKEHTGRIPSKNLTPTVTAMPTKSGAAATRTDQKTADSSAYTSTPTETNSVILTSIAEGKVFDQSKGMNARATDSVNQPHKQQPPRKERQNISTNRDLYNESISILRKQNALPKNSITIESSILEKQKLLDKKEHALEKMEKFAEKNLNEIVRLKEETLKQRNSLLQEIKLNNNEGDTQTITNVSNSTENMLKLFEDKTTTTNALEDATGRSTNGNELQMFENKLDNTDKITPTKRQRGPTITANEDDDQSLQPISIAIDIPVSSRKPKIKTPTDQVKNATITTSINNTAKATERTARTETSAKQLVNGSNLKEKPKSNQVEDTPVTSVQQSLTKDKSVPPKELESSKAGSALYHKNKKKLKILVIGENEEIPESIKKYASGLSSLLQIVDPKEIDFSKTSGDGPCSGSSYLKCLMQGSESTPSSDRSSFLQLDQKIPSKLNKYKRLHNVLDPNVHYHSPLGNEPMVKPRLLHIQRTDNSVSSEQEMQELQELQRAVAASDRRSLASVNPPLFDSLSFLYGNSDATVNSPMYSFYNSALAYYKRNKSLRMKAKPKH